MNFSKKSNGGIGIGYGGIALFLVSSLALTASAQQIYGNVNVSVTAPSAAIGASTTVRFERTNATTSARIQMRAEASSTRSVNIAARQAQQAAMMQKILTTANTEITARINSLNDLISKINSIKNVSAADKASITLTTQNEISTMTALKAKIDTDTGTTTLRADLKSITADYRIYALIEPQLEILTAADRIDQIISLMATVQTKLQTRITALQSAGKDASALIATLADVSAKITDAQTQSSSAVSLTASLTPDQGDATVAAANAAAIKSARADIKTGNSDLQAAYKDLNSIVFGIKGLTPKASLSATTTVSASTTVQ